MISPAVLDAMVQAGCTAEQIAAAVKADMAEGEARKAAKRANNAERQRRYRENHKGDVTESNASNALRGVSNTPPPCPRPFPPQTPPNPTPIPPEITTRARKADNFPCPDWCETAVWADLRANRRKKRLADTATAHAKLVRDVLAMADDEWPPGRLVEAIVARGWAAAYDPREKRNDRTNKPASPNDIQNPYARVAAREAARIGQPSG